MDRHPHAEGFTLVEVLLALTAAALLFSGIFVGLNQALQTRQDLANESTPYEIGPAILDRISRDLGNVYFYDMKENNSFYGTDATLSGREADAVSFLTNTRTFAPEIYNGRDDERHSHLNEVAYLMRRGPSRTPFLELWRREDFFVDKHPHAGGDHVLLYDKVHSLSIQYVSRNPQYEGVAGGNATKATEEMLQEGWNAVQEGGVPRALQITLTIYAKDALESVESRVARGEEPRLYVFKRFVALPQIHMSRDSEGSISGWDGTLSPPSTVTTGRNVRAGAGSRNQEQPVGGGGARRRRNRQGGNRAPGNNPLMNAFRNRGPRSGSGGSNPFSQLTGGGNR